jgi:gamma-glutamyl-gamma-aminobutyrate hydrolase PuuD
MAAVDARIDLPADWGRWMSPSAPWVLVTSIPRSIETTLPGRMDNATINQRFGELIVEAGGVPVATDAWADPEQLLERVDGVVINGGGDVDAARYGAERHPAADRPDPRRDEFEFALVQGAIERGLPLLGVCRGIQLINVALGGDLIQHLPDVTDMNHRVVEWDRPAHEIEIEPGSAIAAALGATRVSVNSVHHQAVGRLGDGLRASARARDGTIEAIEDSTGLVVGIQWHPEFIGGAQAAEQVAVFSALVRLCRTETEVSP